MSNKSIQILVASLAVGVVIGGTVGYMFLWVKLQQ